MAFALPPLALGLVSPLLLLLLSARLGSTRGDQLPSYVPVLMGGLLLPYVVTLAALAAVCARDYRTAPCCLIVAAGAVLGFIGPVTAGPAAVQPAPGAAVSLILGCVLVGAASVGGWRFGHWSVGREADPEVGCS